MLRYAKFLKELCTSKRKLKGNEKVSMGENVSAVLQTKLPPICKDLGMFTIPCKIGNTRFERAMLDLGASINVMPYSIYTSLNLVPLGKTSVIINLLIVLTLTQDELLKMFLYKSMNCFFLLIFFYMIDMENEMFSNPTPILLERPFLKMTRTKIDVRDGTLAMDFNGEIIRFNIFEAMRYPSDVHSVFNIDIIDSLV